MVARQVDGTLKKAEAASRNNMLRTAQVPCTGLLKDVDVLSMFAVWSTTFGISSFAYERKHQASSLL
jgi:hypothetical protein